MAKTKTKTSSPRKGWLSRSELAFALGTTKCECRSWWRENSYLDVPHHRNCPRRTKSVVWCYEVNGKLYSVRIQTFSGMVMDVDPPFRESTGFSVRNFELLLTVEHGEFERAPVAAWDDVNRCRTNL